MLYDKISNHSAIGISQVYYWVIVFFLEQLISNCFESSLICDICNFRKNADWETLKAKRPFVFQLIFDELSKQVLFWCFDWPTPLAKYEHLRGVNSQRGKQIISLVLTFRTHLLHTNEISCSSWTRKCYALSFGSVTLTKWVIFYFT